MPTSRCNEFGLTPIYPAAPSLSVSTIPTGQDDYIPSTNFVPTANYVESRLWPTLSR